MPQKKSLKAVYDNRGMVGIVLRPGTPGFFSHIFEGVLPPRSLACGVFFPWCFRRLLVEVFGEKTSRLKKKMPSLK